MSIATPHHVARPPAGSNRLTTAFLRTNIVNFNPRNVEEAFDLQKALLAKGLIWLTGEQEVQRLEACVKRGLHVDKGRLVTGNDRRGVYVDARLEDVVNMTTAQVKATPMPEPAQKIDREFFAGKRIIFAPKTVGEAAFVQQVLFSFGFSWRNHGQSITNLESCVTEKMIVREGYILYQPSSHKENIEVSVRDLPGYATADLRSPQEKLQARVDTLEAEVAALKAAVAELTAAPARILKSTVADSSIRKPPVL